MDAHPFIDSHCHLDMVLQKIPQGVESQIQEANVTALIHIAADDEAIDFIDAYRAKKLPQDFSFQFFYTIGQHPGEVQDVDPFAHIQVAHARADDLQFVAIGEVGLDYYYGSETKELQKKVFAAYVNLALEQNKPLAIHTRDAHEDTLALLEPAFGNVPVVIHCFTGNKKQMQDYLSHGAYISFSGIVTFKNAKDLQEAAKACPSDRMLIETDAPFLAPVPYRGKPNSSALLPHTFNFLTELRQEADVELFKKQLWKNTFEAFRLS